jgi:hypothetical protein
MTIDTARLETVYDRLAETLDAAPADRREQVLVKLVLLLAAEHPDPDRFEALTAAALRDL